MKRTTYQFKPWSRLQGDAQAVGESLESLRVAHGTLSPSLIVDAATPRNSILHRYFEWDNEKASYKYREIQAAHLLRSITVSRAPGVDIKAPTRAFVSIPITSEESEDTERPGTYTSISEAVRVVDYREQLITNALRDLDAYRLKYQLLSDITGWGTAIVKARTALQRVVDALDAKAA